MDSTNNTNVNEEKSFDIRDVANYLLGKFWIILLAMVCFAVAAIIYTSTITPLYTSKSTVFILYQGTTVNSSQLQSDLNAGNLLTTASPHLVTKEYCGKVAENVSNNTSFTVDKDFVYSCLKVTPDEETSVVTFEATTTNAQLSYHIADWAAKGFEEQLKTFIPSAETDPNNPNQVSPLKANQANPPEVASEPSNIHTARNALLAAAIGAVLSCAVLIVIFMFDDKIKTPDDIDRYLSLNVLGVIPEIDTEA